MPQIAVNPDTMTNVMEGNDWQSEFELDLLGVPKATVRNTSLVIRHDRRWRGVLSRCQVSNRIIKVNLPPMPNSEKGEWTYEDVAALRIWLSHQYGFSPNYIDINDALIVAVKYTQLHS